MLATYEKADDFFINTKMRIFGTTAVLTISSSNTTAFSRQFQVPNSLYLVLVFSINAVLNTYNCSTKNGFIKKVM